MSDGLYVGIDVYVLARWCWIVAILWKREMLENMWIGELSDGFVHQ